MKDAKRARYVEGRVTSATEIGGEQKTMKDKPQGLVGRLSRRESAKKCTACQGRRTRVCRTH